MSSLYYKGSVIYISFFDGRKWRNRSLKLKVHHPAKRSGKWVFPAEAIRIQKQIDVELALGRFGLKPKPRAPSLSSLLDFFLADKSGTISPATVLLYRKSMEDLIDSSGDVAADSLDKAAVASFRSKLLEHHSIGTVGRSLRHIHAVLQFGVAHYNLAENVSHEYRLEPEKKEPVNYSPEELLSWFTTAQKSDPHIFRQCLFLLLTGLRSGESCEFCWHQIADGMMIFRNVKGKRDEAMPIDTALSSLFETCPRDFAPHVFRYRDIFRVNEAHRKVRVAAGLRDGLTVHGLKRAYANTLYDTAGDDLLSVQELAHHSTIQITQKAYIRRRSIETKRAVLERSRGEIASILAVLAKKTGT